MKAIPGWLREWRDASLGWLIRPWVRFVDAPDHPRPAGSAADWVYLLDGASLVDALLLREYCRRHQLPPPRDGAGRSLLRRGGRRWRQRLAGAAGWPAPPARLLPVAVYIGRIPAKQSSLLRLLFAESWALARHLRKLLAVAINGRDTLVVFGQPLAADWRDPEALAEALAARLDQLRSATIGPDFSHRRTLVRELLGRMAVRRAVVADARQRGQRPHRARARAERLLVAMVADCTQITVLVMHRLLGWFWTRFYAGIEARNLGRLRQAAQLHRLVYLPCHRSHIDYLVLSYLLYENGLAIPYVAAGDNLNLPVIGRILRGGGAFFIRRRFKGDRLYAALVFHYLHATLARAAPVEYFIEGGRSRTGRQLPSKAGMLAMTLHSYLLDHQRSLALVPVHISYEKLIEGPSYLDELRGKPKRKESVAGLLRSVLALRGRFGRVVVSFGAPLALGPWLDAAVPQWRAEAYRPDRRPSWLGGAVAGLGRQLGQAINANAHLNPVNLVALSLLATPRQIADSGALQAQIGLLRELADRLGGPGGVSVTELDPASVLRRVEALGMVQRRQDPLGELVGVAGDRAVLLTYYRNNALHVFALPALLAAAFRTTRSLPRSELARVVGMVYPLLADELCIGIAGPALEEALAAAVAALLDLGLLNEAQGQLWRPPATSPRLSRLYALANLVEPSLQRYFLVVAVLLRYQQPPIGRDRLIDLCQALARRLGALYELDAPESVDRGLFAAVVDRLLQQGLLHGDAAAGLRVDPALVALDGEARLLLSEGVRHAVLQQLVSVD